MRTHWLTATLSLLATSVSLTASSVRIVNLPEMVNASTRVFQGRCLSVRELTHANGLPIVEYTFVVSSGLKGTVAGERVVFRQMRSVGVNGFGIAGLPVFKKGQDLVLFLAGDSRIELTSPVGLSQGVFNVFEDRKGQVAVVNGVNNRNLLHNLGPGGLHKMGLKHSQVKLLGGQGLIPLEALSEAVRTIDADRNRPAPGSIQ